MLGEAMADNPATYLMGRPLRLFRRPLEWLRAGCDGAVLLDLPRAMRRLIDVDGRLLAEDAEHGIAIRAALIESARLDRIVITRRSAEEALA